MLLVGDHQAALLGRAPAVRWPTSPSVRSPTSLAEVRRFTAEWEGPASLRLRDGDPSVVAEYVKHGRLVDAGTVEQAEQAAARTWLADTLDGRDALLVVGSNQAAAARAVPAAARRPRCGWAGSRRPASRWQHAGLGWQPSPASAISSRPAATRGTSKGGHGNAEAPINRQTYRVTEVHQRGRLRG